LLCIPQAQDSAIARNANNPRQCAAVKEPPLVDSISASLFLQLLLLEFIDGTSIFVDNLVNGDNLEPRVGGVERVCVVYWYSI